MAAAAEAEDVAGTPADGDADRELLEVLHNRAVEMVGGGDRTLKPPADFYADMDRLLRHHPDKPQRGLAATTAAVLAVRLSPVAGSVI